MADIDAIRQVGEIRSGRSCQALLFRESALAPYHRAGDPENELGRHGSKINRYPSSNASPRSVTL